MATEFNNIDFGFRYGTQRAVDNAGYLEGTFNIATDTGELYIDVDGHRINMNKDIHLYDTEAEIKAILEPTPDRFYYAKDTYRLFVYDEVNLKWVNAGGSPGEVNERIDRLAATVRSLHSFEIVVLNIDDELPEEGQSNIIYFVPWETEDEDTKYDEYVWIENEEYYEKIGVTEADLSNYCKKSDLEAVIGPGYVTDPDSINFKGLVGERLTSNEETIAELSNELNAELGSLDSTATGYITVADRLTELESKMGSTMDPSSTPGFNSVDTRLDTLESSSTADGSDIDELEAKFGSYPASTATGFTSVDDRFSEIEAKIGSTMDPSSTTGFASIDERLDTLESSATTDENDIAELKAKFGTYAASGATGFASVEDRFTTDETNISGNRSNITKIQAQLGSYKEFNETGFVDVESRFNEIEAKLGATMDPSSTLGFSSVDARLDALETNGASSADVTEINNKIGAYPDSTSIGFVSIYEKLIELEQRIAAIEASGLRIADE